MSTRTQRRLILVRHANALEDEGAGDHARRLSPKGQREAQALGSWLSTMVTPQQVFCSTATRTRETLAALGDNVPTVLRDKMYLASAQALLQQLQNADDAVETLLLVGHNPGMHELLDLLVEEYANERDAARVIAGFPTAGCALLQVDAPQWKDVVPQSARLEAFYTGQ